MHHGTTNLPDTTQQTQKSEISISTQEALETLEGVVSYYTKLLGKDEVIQHINPLTAQQKEILKAMQISIFD